MIEQQRKEARRLLASTFANLFKIRLIALGYGFNAYDPLIEQARDYFANDLPVEIGWPGDGSLPTIDQLDQMFAAVKLRAELIASQMMRH